MKNNFHPTSIVSINAKIDPSSIIGPNCVIGENYPRPIVDEKEARLEGVRNSYKARGNPEVRKISQEVNKKHGSRKKSRRKRKIDQKQTKFRNIVK